MQAGNAYGLPAPTLTDNGRVCTARFGGGRSAFEYLTAAPGINQKNGSPNHPRTQGKAERFHPTRKRWLARQPPATALPGPQRQPEAFREHCNGHRPNRAVQRSTPGQAYRALPKAGPARPPRGHCRLRYGHVDAGGKVSIRYAGRMHHPGIGAPRRARRSSLPPARPASPSSNCEPGKPRLPTTSTQPVSTGATNSEARADGPGLLSPTGL